MLRAIINGTGTVRLCDADTHTVGRITAIFRSKFKNPPPPYGRVVPVRGKGALERAKAGEREEPNFERV